LGEDLGGRLSKGSDYRVEAGKEDVGSKAALTAIKSSSYAGKWLPAYT